MNESTERLTVDYDTALEIETEFAALADKIEREILYKLNDREARSLAALMNDRMTDLGRDLHHVLKLEGVL